MIALIDVLATDHVVTTSTSEPKSNMTFAALALRERTNPVLATKLHAKSHHNGRTDNKDSEDTFPGSELHILKMFATTYCVLLPRR